MTRGSNKVVVGLMGMPCVGKDEIFGALQLRSPWQRLSFAQPLKDMFQPLAESLGLSIDRREDKEKLRPLLEVGAEVVRSIDPEWALKRNGRLIGQYERVCITDLRCLNEAQLVWAYGGTVIHVTRKEAEHRADDPRLNWQRENISSVIEYAKRMGIEIPVVRNDSTPGEAADEVLNIVARRAQDVLHGIGARAIEIQW